MGSHPEYKLVDICVWIYEYCGLLGPPPGFRRDLILQGLGPPCLRKRPGRRQDLLIQGLALYAPRAPRAARAPKQFINTGLASPSRCGPLRRPGRRKYLLIPPRAPQPASLRAEGPAIFLMWFYFFAFWCWFCLLFKFSAATQVKQTEFKQKSGQKRIKTTPQTKTTNQKSDHHPKQNRIGRVGLSINHLS